MQWRRDIFVQKIRLPDGSRAIGCIGSSTLSNMADEVPRPCLIGTRIQIDLRASIAPAVPRAHDGARWVPSHRLSQLRQRRLRAHTPSINLIAQIRDVLPRRTAILALKHRKISRRMPRERSSSNDSPVLQLRKPRVGDRFGTAGLVDGVVGEVPPRLWALAACSISDNKPPQGERGHEESREHGYKLFFTKKPLYSNIFPSYSQDGCL